jgi:ElaB/YqjD/DUF883 family membrane-anchored ribosome-binding protein
MVVSSVSGTRSQKGRYRCAFAVWWRHSDINSLNSSSEDKRRLGCRATASLVAYQLSFPVQHTKKRTLEVTPRRSRNKDVQSRVNGLRTDLEKLRRDTVDLAGELNGSTNEAYKNAMQAAQALAEHSFEVAEEASSYIGRTAAQVGEDVEDFTIQGATFVRNTVRDQPLQFLLITLGLGAIIGAFVSRR